jgi:hypothetical protein
MKGLTEDDDTGAGKLRRGRRPNPVRWAGKDMKDTTFKMIRLAPESDGTAAVPSERPEGAFPVAPLPLQVEHPDGLEGGGLAGKPKVRIMSMTWIPSCGGTACGERPTEYGQPILTVVEAARVLGVSRKRLENIIFEEKSRLGRMPDFVCDAGGKIQRRILRDELIEWAKAKRVKRGRPTKTVR